MRSYKLYGTQSASTNQVAYVTIQKTGKIKSFRWTVAIASKTDAARVVLEASLVSTIQNTVNDSLGPLDQVEMYGNFVTSGLAHSSINKQSLVDIPVVAGERISVNAYVSGTATFYATLFIDVAD